MSLNLDSLKSNSEFNIVMLGETGTGKSTTINALANYLKYATFEQASAGEFVQLISSNFALPNPVTGEPWVIASGSDANEHHSNGNSSTQAPMGYLFRTAGRTIRIIDTPGMGDTSGIDTDKENFEKILFFLRHHKNLHGICILVRANESRKTTFFRYCLNELLTHLHKSACRNIVFCFTHSRNTFFEPGDGFITLKAFLSSDLKDVDLQLRPGVNCYFIDNEAYRFLVAKKQGYPFSNEKLRLYKESWERSAKQIESMIKHVTKLDPHILEQTALLNNVRQMLIKLAEPLVKLQANIKDNIAHVKAEEIKLRNPKATPDELARLLGNMTLEVDELEMRPLSYPTTVCTSQQCVEVVDTNGAHSINYKTRCHESCQLNGVEVNLIGDPILRGCWAMASTQFCERQCGCSWQKHMHITCIYEKVKKTIIRKSAQSQLSSPEGIAKYVNETIQSMQKVVREYEQEVTTIQEISSKFAYILSFHSNTPYNQYIEPYLDLLIEEEQTKIHAVANYNRTKLDSLLQTKKSHQESVQFLGDAIANKSQQTVRIDDVPTYRDRLMCLKHTGAQFRQMIQIDINQPKRGFKYQEKVGLDL